MNSETRILAKLRAHKPFTEIRTEESSISKLYEVAGQYLDEINSELDAKREETRKLEHAETNLGANVEALKIERGRLANENAALSKNLDSVRNTFQKTTVEVTGLQEHRDKVLAEIEVLAERGFTAEIMGKLRTANRNGAEVDAILTTQGGVRELDNEIATSEKAKRALNDELIALQKKAQRIKKKLASKENKLDLVETQLAISQQVVDVVNAAIRDGYSPEQLRAMILLLRKLEIQANPTQSINHLLQCLVEAKNLLSLKNKVNLAESKFNELLKAEAETKARIEILQNAFLSEMASAGRTSEKTIASVALHLETELSRVVSSSVDAIRTASSTVNEALRCEVDELGRLKEEKGKLESFLEPAHILLGMVGSSELLKTISAALVIALLQNIAMWCDLKSPDAEIGALYDTVANEFQHCEYAIPRFRISALLRLAAEGVNKTESHHLKEKSR